jgi:hypothetical protein
MIHLYISIFVALYRFWQVVGDGGVNYSPSNRAFVAVGFMTMLEMLNGASFSANKFGTFFFFLYAVFFVPNYLLFLWQDRFFEIVRKPVSGLHTASY